MAIVQHKRGNQAGTAWSLAFDSNVAAGNLIALFILEADSGAGPVGVSAGPSDGLSNTYANAGFNVSGALVASGYFAKDIAGGACTISATMASAITGSLDIWELSGRDTVTGLDDAQFNGDAGGSSSVDPTVSITTAEAGEDLVVGVAKSGEITVCSAPFVDELVGHPDNWTGSAQAANQAAATYTPTWTKLADGPWAIGVMAFLPSGAAPTGVKGPLIAGQRNRLVIA